MRKKIKQLSSHIWEFGRFCTNTMGQMVTGCEIYVYFTLLYLTLQTFCRDAKKCRRNDKPFRSN